MLASDLSTELSIALIVQYIGEEKHHPATSQTKLLSNASAYLWINHFSGQKSFLLKGLMEASVSELEADNNERATAATVPRWKTRVILLLQLSKTLAYWLLTLGAYTSA